jgi:hypothetical protein
MNASRNSAAKSVAPLAYHRRIADHFRTTESELWKWFATSDTRTDDADTLRLELLKTTYRLDSQAHPALFQVADELRSFMSVSGTVSIYQTQIGEGFNASLSYLPGEAHIVLAGPVFTLLSAEELRALLAHELAHFLLYSDSDGEFRIASDLIRGLAQDVGAGPEFVETARLWNLFTELYCDRWALAAAGDLGVVVRTLVKAQTGLGDVNADSYMRQAAEILRAGPLKADHFTHPELYIRARALELWHQVGADAEPQIERLIQGSLNLQQLDVLAQRTASDLTAAMIGTILEPAWMRTEANLAHARQFFPDFEARPAPKVDVVETLAKVDSSTLDYACYVLLDFAAVDRELGDAAVARAFLQAKAWAIEERFTELAQRELGWTKKAWTRLVKDAESLIQQAAKSFAQEAPA